MQWKESLTMDENSFKPVSRKSQRDTRTFTLNFSDNITGEFTDNKTGQKKQTIMLLMLLLPRQKGKLNALLPLLKWAQGYYGSGKIAQAMKEELEKLYYLILKDELRNHLQQ